MICFSLPSPGPSACLFRGELSLPIIGLVLVSGYSCTYTGPVLSHMGLCHRWWAEQYLCPVTDVYLLQRWDHVRQLAFISQPLPRPGTNWGWSGVLHPTVTLQLPPFQCNLCWFLNDHGLCSIFWLWHLLASKWEEDRTRGSKGYWKLPLDLRLNGA